MRKWRVGTVSMALALILMGVFLIVSQVLGMAVWDSLLAWWPLIFVLLGLEILIFVFFSGKEQIPLNYDMISILFIGFLGTICIGFVMLVSTGIMGEIRSVIRATDITKDLPAVHQPLSAGIQRIVVQTTNRPVKITGTEKREIHLFGTYRANEPSDQPVQINQKDFSSIETIGNTMYLTLKDLPEKRGPLSTRTDLQVTLALPKDVQVEVNGKNNRLEISPGKINSNWLVKNGQIVVVNLQQSSNVLFTSITQGEPSIGNAKWDQLTIEKPQKAANQTKEENLDGEVTRTYHGSLKLGSGTSQLDVLQSDDVMVNVLKTS